MTNETMPRASGGRLLMFCKGAESGKVKTRLIPGLGCDGALQLHKRLCTDRLAWWRSLGVNVVIYQAGDDPEGFLSDLAASHQLPLRQQSGSDLGARMFHAASLELENAPWVMITGSDVFGIDAVTIDECIARLEEGADCVIVPAEDGGYGLIGLRRVARELFSGIAWGGSTVFDQTVARLDRLNWRWHSIGRCWDVDRPDDVARLPATLAEV